MLQSNDLPWEIVLREENTSLPPRRSLSRLRGLPVASAPYLHLPQSPRALWDIFTPAHRNSERIPYDFQTLWCGFESIGNVRPWNLDSSCKVVIFYSALVIYWCVSIDQPCSCGRRLSGRVNISRGAYPIVESGYHKGRDAKRDYSPETPLKVFWMK